MTADYRTNVVEDHHLNRSTRINVLARATLRWMSRTCPTIFGGLGNVLHDMEDEELLLQKVEECSCTVYRDPPRLEDVQRAFLDSLEVLDTGFIQFGTQDPAPIDKSPLCEMKVSARVVAEVRIAVVARIGELPDNEANRVLADKVARKVMKDAGFRDVVAVTHLPQVVNAYFTCKSHLEKSGRARKRCSKWLLRLLGFAVPTSATT